MQPGTIDIEALQTDLENWITSIDHKLQAISNLYPRSNNIA